MSMPGRKFAATNEYRYGFNGKENDKDISEGGQDYGMRIYDSRLGRFLSEDPLTEKYPMLTPYQFSSNTPVSLIDLDGLEGTFPLPRISFPRLTLPRISINIPRAPSIPIPTSPGYPVPPVISIPDLSPYVPKPITPSTPYVKKMESSLDWTQPPYTPDQLSSDWQETTDTKNQSGSRNFKNDKTNEEIRFDPGKEGKPGWEGKNHWHRLNPNRTSKGDEYLDRFGNAVPRGSGPSHIGAGESFLEAIPSIISDQQQILNGYQKERDKYNILNPFDWKKIKEIRDKMKPIEKYIEKLENYQEEWKEYHEKLKENGDIV